MSTLRKEHKLLILLSQTQIKEETYKSINELISQGIEWDFFISESIHHKVCFLCYHQLVRYFENKTPSTVLKKLSQKFDENKNRNEYLLHEVKTLSDSLNQAGIIAVFIKGLTLAKLAYENYTLRKIGDTDILVHPSQIQKASELLRDLGYEQSIKNLERNTSFPLPKGMTHGWQLRTHHHLFFFSKQGSIEKEHLIKTFEIDLHHHIIPPTAPYELDINNLFQHLTEIDINGVKLQTLINEYNLLFLCEHLFRESRFKCHIEELNDQKLSKYCDINEFLKKKEDQIDWDVFLRLVKDARMEIPIYYSLHNLEKIYGRRDISSYIMEEMKLDKFDFLQEFYSCNNYGSKKKKATSYFWKTSFLYRMFDKKRMEKAKKIIAQNPTKRPIIKCHKLNDLIDGNKEDVKNIEENKEYFYIRESQVPEWQPFGTHVQAGDLPLNDDDLSARFWVSWSKKCFNFSIEIIDDMIIPSSLDEVGFFYDQDAVRLFFCTDSENVKSYFLLLQNLKQEKVIFIEQDLNVKGFKCRQVTIENINTIIKKNGYSISVGIPFNELGISPMDGLEIGFDVEIEDCDDKDEGLKRSFIWAGGEMRSPFDPSVLGRLIFKEEMF